MFGVLANNTKYQGNSYWLKNKSADVETPLFSYQNFCNNDDKVKEENLVDVHRNEKSQQELYEELKTLGLSGKSRIRMKSAVETVSLEKEVPKSELKNIGLTCFELSDTHSQMVLASLVKSSENVDPIIQIAYGQGDARKVYHVHVNDIDTTNVSDLEMFALLSYEGYKGRTVPNSINNYSAYKTLKFEAGFGMSSESENSFVNEKINARKLLQEVYEFLKEGKTSEEKKSAEGCDYLIQLLRKNENL